MISIQNFSVPICVVAAAIAALVTGEPEIAKLWFAVWNLK